MAAPATAAGPRWRGTVLYPMALVALFLGGQALAGLLGVPSGQRATLAALPAVLALVLSLPARVRRAWGDTSPWRSLGVQAPSRLALLRALLRGLLKAVLLLALVLVVFQLAGILRWQAAPSAAIVVNGLALGLGVGLAEELLFRGWLLGELERNLGSGGGLLAQAAVFSLVHLRFNLPLGGLLGLLGGLALLGLVLGLQRRVDGGLIWGAVGLHGGLVGLWFVLQRGEVISLLPQAPLWLTGPANPIGGLAGWGALLLLLVQRLQGLKRSGAQRTAVARAGRP